MAGMEEAVEGKGDAGEVVEDDDGGQLVEKEN